MGDYNNLVRSGVFFVVACWGLASAPGIAAADGVLEVGKFSAAKPGQPIPQEWQLQTFKSIPRSTSYALVDDSGTVVVRAESRSSFAALVRKIRIDPREYPIVTWRWKTSGVYRKGDATRKEGDDYSARLYIVFEYQPETLSAWEMLQYQAARLLYGEYPPTAAINYIWANRVPVGSVIPNAFSERAMMFVLESGDHRRDTWVEEQRNVYADYLQAFNREPPVITAVAVANDSDNTGESSVSFFGDIEFRKE